MKTININELEQHIDALINSIEKIKAENRFLRHQLNDSQRKSTLLQQNNHQLAKKIRLIINNLQEKSS